MFSQGAPRNGSEKASRCVATTGCCGSGGKKNKPKGLLSDITALDLRCSCTLLAGKHLVEGSSNRYP